jgi:hypothetical protein
MTTQELTAQTINYFRDKPPTERIQALTQDDIFTLAQIIQGLLLQAANKPTYGPQSKASANSTHSNVCQLR